MATATQATAKAPYPKPRRLKQLRQEYAKELWKFRQWAAEDDIQHAIQVEVCDLIDRLGRGTLTPYEYVRAIKAATVPCDHCDGSGHYKWGACINGRMQHSAVCFRCKGKGRMDGDDCVRTRIYHNKLRVI